MRRLALTAALVASALLAPTANAAPQLPLSHVGRWISDASGRLVVLHGLNMVYKRPPYAPDAVGFDGDDAAFLSSEGYNTVRLGLIYKAVEPQPGKYDDAYLRRIETTVNTLGKRGIVSLLDFHQDLLNERFQGEGFPDWAVQDGGLPNPQNGFPNNYLTNPALNHAFDQFWVNAAGPGGVGLQDRYAAAWRHVAARFKNNRYVLGYDLLNEPWPGSSWPQCAQPAGCPAFDLLLGQFVDRVRTQIRKSDPSRLIFYEPQVLFNNGSDTNLPKFDDKNMAMSFHDYCLTANEGGMSYGPACQQSDSLVFNNAEKHATSTGDGLLLTEFGATDDRDALLGPLTLADQHMMSWQEWHYCPCNDPTTTGEGAKQAIVLNPKKLPAGKNLKTSTLNVLTRPYPRLISGSPVGWSFDPDSRQFTFSYNPDHVDGSGPFGYGTRTEIVVPARQYPRGYSADVRGGAIVSADGAHILRVATCGGGGTITVNVVPGRSPNQSSCAIKTPFGTTAKLSVSVKPASVVVGRRVKITVTVRVVPGRKVLRGAVVRLSGRKGITNGRGRVVFKTRFENRGKHRIVARARGYKTGRAALRVHG